MNLGLFNLDLLSVGVVVATTGILGFVVFFNNSRSATNRIFLAFSLVTSAWGVVNYLNYQVGSSIIALWLIRLVLFFATWQAFCLFYLFYAFPSDTLKLPKLHRIVLIPLVAFTSLLTLTPLVLKKVEEMTVDGRVSKIANGPGIILFGLVSVGLVISGIVYIIKKILKANFQEKKPLRLVLAGTFLTFALIIAFNFIFPAFLSDARFIPYGAVFTFPFIAFTAYAIFKHRLLNIKVLSTEILVFPLTIAMLIEVILSQNTVSLVFRFSVFLLVLSVGILLINSVLKEVKQREKLQELSKQLEKVNEKLKVLDKARAEFISIASHQLRAPPATIKWYLAAIRIGDFGHISPKVLEAVKKTEMTNNALISLIDDLLNVSRIERGKMEFLFENTDLVKIVDEAVNELIPQATAKRLKLLYQKPVKRLPMAVVDREKLQQAIANVIDNAIKYTKKGAVTVNLGRNNGNFLIKVTDTGKGMDRDEIGRIFDKYGRGKDAATHAPGLGLGLYVCKVIIEHHHGAIKAESAGEGRGSTFVISLPIHTKLAKDDVFDLTKEAIKT